MLVLFQEDYPDVDQKSLFAALSLSMKETCKKAAKAVRETRNIGAPPDNMKRNGIFIELHQLLSVVLPELASSASTV